MKQIVRTQDRLYLKENRYKKPKQLHLDIIKLLKKNLKTKSKLFKGVITDFGCSNGEFLYVINKKFPNASLRGIDILSSLIKKAKKKLRKNKKIHLQIGSVINKNTLKKNFSDISIMSGVLSIFDEFETVLDNLINWTKKNGSIYIAGLFNNYPIDTYV